MPIEIDLGAVIKQLEQAFDTPLFLADSSEARLKGALSTKILQTSIERLDKLTTTYPESAEILFLAGISARYLVGEQAFQRHVQAALSVDSDHIEAAIAAKEGQYYRDPFCYLNIEDVLSDPDIIPRTVASSLQLNSARIDQVRDGLDVIPMLTLRLAQSRLRPRPQSDIDVGLAVELCSVLPESPGIPEGWHWPIGDSSELTRVMQPFLDVLAGKKHFTTLLAACVVFANHPDDLFCIAIPINVFPKSTSVYTPDYQPFGARHVGLRLCSPPYKVMCVLLEEDGRVLLCNCLSLVHMKDELAKVAEAIRLLSGDPIDLADWERAIAVYESHWSCDVVGSSGTTYSVPTDRTGKERVNIIFGLEARDGKLSAKREAGRADVDELEYDIFLSHSHDDQPVAYTLTEWIGGVWPASKVFTTARTQRKVNELVPGHYVLGLHASKCVIFLATSSSLASSHALVELGAASQLDMPVIGICHSGAAVKNLEATGLRRYCSAVLTLDSADAESTLLKHLSEALDWEIPAEYRTGSLGRLLEKRQHMADVDSNKSAEEIGLLDPEKLARGEPLSREDALRWLDVLEENVEHKARMAGLEPERWPRTDYVPSRLVRVMMTSDETKFDDLLRPFATLIDEDFCRWVEYMGKLAYKQDASCADGYRKLMDAARRIVDEGGQRAQHKQ